jgi:hypothetical protein
MRSTPAPPGPSLRRESLGAPSSSMAGKPQCDAAAAESGNESRRREWGRGGGGDWQTVCVD